MPNLKQEIYKHIKAAYKVFDTPQYHFLQITYDKQPYKPLITQLEQRFGIVDDTDLNDDVALFLILQKDTVEWALNLSLVGPYAMLGRLGDKEFEVITIEDILTEPEQEICQLCKTYSVTLLNRSLLESSVQIKLSEVEPNNTKLYQVLFTATDILPWTHWTSPER